MDLKSLEDLKKEREAGLLASIIFKRKQAKLKGLTIFYGFLSSTIPAIFIGLFVYIGSIETNFSNQSWILFNSYFLFNKIDVIFTTLLNLINNQQIEISFYIAITLSISALIIEGWYFIGRLRGREWDELNRLTEGDFTALSDEDWSTISKIPHDMQKEVIKNIKESPFRSV